MRCLGCRLDRERGERESMLSRAASLSGSQLRGSRSTVKIWNYHVDLGIRLYKPRKLPDVALSIALTTPKILLCENTVLVQQYSRSGVQGVSGESDIQTGNNLLTDDCHDTTPSKVQYR